MRINIETFVVLYMFAAAARMRRPDNQEKGPGRERGRPVALLHDHSRHSIVQQNRERKRRAAILYRRARSIYRIWDRCPGDALATVLLLGSYIPSIEEDEWGKSDRKKGEFETIRNMCHPERVSAI